MVTRSRFIGRIRNLKRRTVAFAFLLVLLVAVVTGSVYYSLVMQSGTTVSSPPVELQEGTAGNSTIYENKTSASVSVSPPDDGSTYSTYYPGGYNVVNGSYVSGSLPTSVESVDSDFFVVQGAITSQTSTSYYPSAYSELGSTSWVSGGLSNLTSDDGVYMSFLSYPTSNGTTSYNPGNYTLLGSTTLMSGSVSDLVSDDGSYLTFGSYATGNNSTLYAHNETRSIASNSYYEMTINPADIAGVTLQVDAGTTGRKLFGNWTYPLITVSSIPSGTWTFYYRTQASAAAVGAHCDVDILVRMANGTVRQTIATDVANSTDAANNWETRTGAYNFPGYTVVNQTDYVEIDFYGHVTTTKAGATHSLRIDDNTLAYADQTRVESTVPVDFNVGVELTGSSNDYNWEQLVWNVDSACTNASVSVTIQVYNYTLEDYPSGGDGYISYTSSATPDTDETKNQTITTSPESFRNSTGGWKIKMTVAKNNSTYFEFKVDWTDYKPTHYDEYTVEVEFSGSSNTDVWSQLFWNIDSAWNLSSISVTFQLYNYTLDGYPSSGDGYISYTSSATPDTDETKNQTITTSPESFRNSTGWWKVKVTGVKTTTTQFAFKVDLTEFKPTHNLEYTVSTEFTFSGMTTNTPLTLNFTLVSQYDVGSVNVTIQVYNYTSFSYVTSGQGYLNYNSSSTPNTDETKLLNITTNPEDYVSSGNAKIKVMGFKEDYQPNQKMNQLKLDYEFARWSTHYPDSYNVLNGTYVSGSLPSSVTSVDADYFTVRSEGTDTSSNVYNPAGYTLLGSTSWVSGSVSNLTSDDDVYMIFRSYPMPPTSTSYFPSSYTLLGSTSLVSGTVDNLDADDGSYMTFRSYATGSFSTEYAHNETQNIGGTDYYTLKTDSADGPTISLEVDAEFSGRVSFGNFTYPLSGVSSIPSGDWTFFYRASNDFAGVVFHCDVDIKIRMSNGTVRQTIATNVANSLNVTETLPNWETVNGTYSFPGYTVVNQTDYLEIDYYADISSGASNKHALLRVDDDTLATSDQTRLEGTVPADFVSETEFTGSSNIYDGWTQLFWNVDQAFTLGTVNVTMQLYNYTSGSYPTSGNGYLNYNSSSTANTDETKNQTITTNSEDFRDEGGWKLKTRAFKNSSSSFDMKVDLSEYEPTYGSTANQGYNPTGYMLLGNTTLSGGSVSNLTSNDGSYMIFRGYATGNSSTLYMHNETRTIASNQYYEMTINPADIDGVTLEVGTDTLGRKLFGNWTYPLTGVSSIPSGTWTFYYRTILSSTVPESHCDVDILVRMANGTVRQTIATHVANSSSATNTWQTLNGTYNFPGYTVVNQTDYLEIDFYGDVTTVKSNAYHRLQIDYDGLAYADQTRLEGTVPVDYVCEVELAGSSNDYDDWTQLLWNVDSAWTNASINMTIQVYNYTLGDYPTSGDGYINYTSSATPNTDETKNQTITTSPESFRNSTGWWKIKIKGAKNNSTIFELKVDWAEYKPTYVNKYICEVELYGSSNTYNWQQLFWNIDSAWTTGSVTATLQLYNYTLTGYSRSGDGYLNYTSSATANTDETKNQTITTSPQSFRNSTGWWKIRITGDKTTTYTFDLKVDLTQYNVTHYSEYTVSTEFTFSGLPTDTPFQLNFTAVSQYDIATTNVTIQVYNYTGSAYPTGGDGYLAYNSSATPSVDETKNLPIDTNPQFYTSSGAAKIKITAAKTTTTQFQQKTNQLKLNYGRGTSPGTDQDFNHVLEFVEKEGSNWKVRLKAYDQSNIARLDNCTIYIYDGSNSTQIVISSGAYSQQTGPWYDLNASETEYIWMHVETSSAGTSYIYVYLEILVPNKTVYARYIITFEIT